ncbi:MAG TPA: RNA polymerase sigma factor [Oligoflexus sp.]|uniref:RNA polymerase sigma factor n=1 Tax=Oligoflexus sp. TaxID=1971216 RepID=UPI002D60A50A|nr:RNA polymerase sigma factor [Oligoflexus sp.]HYX37702.1 RNA polymerase sigma factor [Oligoflexus sp.]
MGLFTLRRQCRTPEHSAFHEFYRATLRPLTSHLHALGLRSSEELEDILQNTYLEAHKSFESLQDSQAALAWLLTIGRRQFYQYIGRQVRLRRVFEERAPEEPDVTAPIIDHRLVAADEQMHTDSVCQIVVQKIFEIKNPMRQQAIRMFFLEEFHLKEIAESTGTKISTLTTWISRFRKDICQLLLIEQESTDHPKAATISLSQEGCI